MIELVHLHDIEECEECYGNDCNKLNVDSNIYISSYNPDKWNETTENTLNPDEIVISDTDITIVYDYPLSKEFKFTYYSESGFSRKQLIELIVNEYKNIYKEEEDTTENISVEYIDDNNEKKVYTGKVIPEHIRVKVSCLINRHKTQGKYGIWGHDISDLVIEGITYNKNDKTVNLLIGS